MESFERHVYEKDLNGNPRSYCGKDLTSELFYFRDVEHSEVAPKINLAVCSSCSFAIQNKKGNEMDNQLIPASKIKYTCNCGKISEVREFTDGENEMPAICSECNSILIVPFVDD